MRLSTRVGRLERQKNTPGKCRACGGAGAFVIHYEHEPTPPGCNSCGRIHTIVQVCEAAPSDGRREL